MSEMSEDHKGYICLGLVVENYRVIKLVRLEPDAEKVTLVGNNGQGKSTILDALFHLCQNAEAKKRISMPIRKGEDYAKIEAKFGDETGVKLIATRRFSGDQNYVEVRNVDGMKFDSPETVMKNLCSHLTFDPLSFNNMSKKQRREILMELADLDFNEIDKRHIDLYDKRTTAGRLLSDSAVAFKMLHKPADDCPDNTISISSLTDELKEKNKLAEEYRWKKEQWVERVDAANEKTKQFEEAILEISELEADFKTAFKRLTERAEAAKELSVEQESHVGDEPVPEEWKGTENIMQALNDAEANNALVQKKLAYLDHKNNVEKYDYEHEKLEQEVTKCFEEKKKMISNASYPLDGLSVDSESVLYEGIPYDELSTGQMIKVSTAIAMKLNPNFKVIMLRNANDLDKINMKIILDMAKAEQYQVWIEKLEDDSPAAIRFEDGEVVSPKTKGK